MNIKCVWCAWMRGLYIIVMSLLCTWKICQHLTCLMISKSERRKNILHLVRMSLEYYNNNNKLVVGCCVSVMHSAELEERKMMTLRFFIVCIALNKKIKCYESFSGDYSDLLHAFNTIYRQSLKSQSSSLIFFWFNYFLIAIVYIWNLFILI